MCYFALFVIAAMAGGLGRQALADGDSVRAFFEARCADCHGAEAQEGGLCLDTLIIDFAAADCQNVPRRSPFPCQDNRSQDSTNRGIFSSAC